jgi:predicted O-linked N-acetylglucosamine transferase (SPINDLY family)
MPGTFMRGRHTSAILGMMGVTDTIAPTLDDYVAIAVRLAQDAAWRADVQSRMSQHAGRVYRDQACISALQDFLDRVGRGLPPP